MIGYLKHLYSACSKACLAHKMRTKLHIMWENLELNFPTVFFFKASKQPQEIGVVEQGDYGTICFYPYFFFNLILTLEGDKGYPVLLFASNNSFMEGNSVRKTVKELGLIICGIVVYS